MTELILTGGAAGVALVSSGVLGEELAKKKNRGRAFQFIVGLLLGPLGLLFFLVPQLDYGRESTLNRPVGNRPLRVIEGFECPRCENHLPPHTQVCPFCMTSTQRPWWERVQAEV